MQYATIKKFWIAVVITASVAALAMRSRPQSTSPGRKEQPKKVRDLPIVDFYAPEANDVRRKAKGNRYDRQSSEPIQETPSISGRVWSNHWARGLDAFPVDKSDTILIGSITDVQGYLSNDKTAVYSEFSIQVEEVLKQPAPKPPVEVASTISVERFGGAVRFPSGAIQRYETMGQGMPHRDGRYLLFLKRLDDEPSFSIITGYELGDVNVSPLDGAQFGEGTERYPFDKYEGYETATFLQAVRTAVAAKSRSTP